MNRIDKAKAFRKSFESNLNATRSIIKQVDLSEEEYEDLIGLYPPYAPDTAYQPGDIISYGNILYKVVQSHTSQSDWLPTETPALYTPFNTPITEDGSEVIMDWVQPTGGHDTYNEGDKVIFEGEVYESTIDANTWSPSEYPQGWKVFKGEEVPVESEEEELEPEEKEPIKEEEEIIEDPIEEEPEPEENIEEWKQPTGGHDAYNTGDKVSLNDKVYESIISGNSWSPTDYPQGWKEIK